MRDHPTCQNFDPRLLLGVWNYQDAHTEFADGRPDAYNFTPHPAGRFIITPGYYSHIVMSPDLPKVASGLLKVMTPEEAMAIAINQLSHYGTWVADPAAGTFTVQIEKCTFPNFDGISQVRTITVLSETELQYVNHTVSNGADAVVVAGLSRLQGYGEHHH